MKIGLMGYGKMGREIEAIAIGRGHSIAFRIDSKNASEFSSTQLKEADVIIEFTSPHTVLSNIEKCFDAGVPVVVGSTGWLNSLEQVRSGCAASNGTLIYGSNFSIGVNIFFAINRKLASIMNRFKEYNVEIEEIHHTQKLDAPSGTAITLANGILRNIDRKSSWVNDTDPSESELLIRSVREDAVPGTHKITYSSDVDQVDIIHTAHNRKGFALGAVVAAEWIKDKKGFFEIGDMLQFD